MSKVGRPTKYSQELATRICSLVAEGASLRDIASLDGMPTRETIRTWIRDKGEFSAQYAQAKEYYADTEFERMFELADNVGATHEEIAKARLQIDVRKWALSKLLPKKYGDRIQTDHDGSVSIKIIDCLGDGNSNPE